MLTYEPVTSYTRPRPPRTRVRALVALVLVVLSGYALADYVIQHRIARETALYNEAVRATARVQPEVRVARSVLRPAPTMAFGRIPVDLAGAGPQRSAPLGAGVYIPIRSIGDQRSRMDSRKSSPVFESYVSQDASAGWCTSSDSRKP